MAERRRSRRARCRRGSLRRALGDVCEVAHAGAGWHQRTGLLLRVEEDGVAGFGEASPLPGYSPESLDEAEADLCRWIDAGCGDGTEAICSPSARFAADTALLDLRGRRQGLPLWRLLGGPEGPASIPAAALIAPADEEETLARARLLLAGGVRTFKLKVGPEVGSEVRRLEALRRDFGDAVTLRLDANRSLDPTTAQQVLAAWAEFDIEFIEEPTSDPRRIAESPIALALDESLQGPESAEETWDRIQPWVDDAPCIALVLKPTVLGLAKCRELARQARQAGLDAIVSHTFEGPVAFQACAHLALALGGRRACGLGLHGGLDAWPEVESSLVTRSRVDPARSVGPGLGVDGDTLWKRLEEPSR